ncbi:MAG: arsenate reductase (glutaredoxin) [Rhodobacterales bacterium]|nr:MAG: arsenate reductase (glutaredoxin) [Rhodobacterales bacterium]
MTHTTIWHNPRCSKSRQTLALLEERGVTLVIRKYLDDAPTVDDLRQAAEALGLGPSGFVRKGEAEFKELGLSLEDDPDTLFAAMAAHPRLIERPIVFVGGKAALGRPPEQVLTLLG